MDKDREIREFCEAKCSGEDVVELDMWRSERLAAAVLGVLDRWHLPNREKEEHRHAVAVRADFIAIVHEKLFPIEERFS